MNCEKCGKELEFIKTDTGGAFLPCNCHKTAKLIACALRENRISAFQEAYLEFPSQDNEGYVPDRGGFKCGWNAAFYHYNVLKMALALETAIEYMKRGAELYDCDDYQGIAAEHCKKGLDAINEVCK